MLEIAEDKTCSSILSEICIMHLGVCVPPLAFSNHVHLMEENVRVCTMLFRYTQVCIFPSKNNFSPLQNNFSCYLNGKRGPPSVVHLDPTSLSYLFSLNHIVPFFSFQFHHFLLLLLFPLFNQSMSSK